MAVSQNCPYPGRALAFINLLNTNEELLNLICFGQEDVDWTWVDKENKLIELEFGAYPGNEPFLVGNTFLSYHVDESQIGCWEETDKINKNAAASPLLGFTFDSKPVRAQMSTINGNIDEYLEPILCGMGEGGTEAAIAALNEFLYDAGLQDILDEMQSQVNEWLENQ
jgi:putative aldouronate transport system substrate-binding protein